MKAPLSLLALAAAAFLQGCAQPNLEIDTTEMENGLGQHSVGLVEVQGVFSGSMGFAPFKTMRENDYCTGTLLKSGQVLVSTDCLRSGKTEYDPKDMRFYLKDFSTGKTKKYEVAAIASVDSARHAAYLNLKNHPDGAVARPPAQRSTWTDESTDPNQPVVTVISAQVVSISEPNEKGKAKARLLNVTLEAGQATPTSRAAPRTPPGSSPQEPAPNGDEEEFRGDGSEHTPSPPTTPVAPPAPAQPAAPASTEQPRSPFASSRGVVVTNMEDGRMGSPIFYQGQLVGFIRGSKNGPSRENGQWLVGQ